MCYELFFRKPSHILGAQLTFTSSKLTIETLEQAVKYVENFLWNGTTLGFYQSNANLSRNMFRKKHFKSLKMDSPQICSMWIIIICWWWALLGFKSKIISATSPPVSSISDHLSLVKWTRSKGRLLPWSSMEHFFEIKKRFIFGLVDGFISFLIFCCNIVSSGSSNCIIELI